MTAISPAMQAHLESGATTLCGMAMLQRRDGTRLGLAAHPRDLTFNGETYYAATSFTPSAVVMSEGLSVDNLEILGVLDNERITEADIRAKLYQGAKLWSFLVNYEDLSMGMIPLPYGTLGDITLQRNGWVVEFRSLPQLLDTEIGGRHGRMCPYTLGDDDCKVNLAEYTFTGTLTGVTDNLVFSDVTRGEAENYFQFGKFTFTDGPNAGYTMDVKRFVSGQFTLKFPLPHDVAVGHAYNVEAGCNHFLKMPGDVWLSPYTGDCRDIFNNGVNSGARPDIPTADQVLAGS